VKPAPPDTRPSKLDVPSFRITDPNLVWTASTGIRGVTLGRTAGAALLNLRPHIHRYCVHHLALGCASPLFLSFTTPDQCPLSPPVPHSPEHCQPASFTPKDPKTSTLLRPSDNLGGLALRTPVGMYMVPAPGVCLNEQFSPNFYFHDAGDFLHFVHIYLLLFCCD